MNVLEPFDKYTAERTAGTVGGHRHLQSALRVAEAAFNLREHFPEGRRKTRTQVVSECPDYRLIGDASNAVKHKQLTKPTSEGPPIVKGAEDIHDALVCVEFEDPEGKYVDVETEIQVICTDGVSRSLDFALTNVVNYWGNELVRLGIISGYQDRRQSEHGKRLVSRADSRRPNLEMRRGLPWQQRYQIMKFNVHKRLAEPVNLKGANIQWRMYAPQYSFTVSIKTKGGDEYEASIPASDEDSLAYSLLNSDAERKSFGESVMQARREEIQALLRKAISEGPKKR
jgi:hypothetical protein